MTNNIFQTILRQFLRFSSVGAISTAAQYSVLILLLHTVDAISAVVASTIGFIIGAIINYQLNCHFTFKTHKKHRETLPRFFLIALIGLCINSLIMFIAVNIMGLYYLLAQIMATGLVLLWTFSCNRIWTFKEVTHETPA